jgi:hypothetical protein
VRVIAVLQDGPKRGLEITLVGQSAVEVLAVPEVPIPLPLDLGPPAPGEPLRRVGYWYRNSQRVGGPPRYYLPRTVHPRLAQAGRPRADPVRHLRR